MVTHRFSEPINGESETKTIASYPIIGRCTERTFADYCSKFGLRGRGTPSENLKSLNEKSRQNRLVGSFGQVDTKQHSQSKIMCVVIQGLNHQGSTID